MDNKIAIKRLTASDLTILRAKYGLISKSRQKAINLNADVFTGVLYPALDAAVAALPLTLSIMGPGSASRYQLTRKIVPPSGGYKNWRLNGELVSDPEGETGRFDALIPGDIAVFSFSGDARPTHLDLYFLAENLSADRSLWAALNAKISAEERRSFRTLSAAELEALLDAAGMGVEHPMRAASLTYDDPDVEQAALGNPEAAQRLARRGGGRAMSSEELARAKEKAAQVGRAGEVAVNELLQDRLEAAELAVVRWIADENAVAPFDFEIALPDGSNELIDVKSTGGDHDRPIHLSWGELTAAASAACPYRLYRVSGLGTERPELRISEPINQFCTRVKEQVSGLPAGLVADGFTVAVSLCEWSDVQRLGEDNGF